MVYEFYVHDMEVRENLAEALDRGGVGTEKMLEIVYQPQAKFRVRSVTHCTSSIPGEECSEDFLVDTCLSIASSSFRSF